MKIKICVSIPPKTIKEAFNLLEQAEVEKPDIIEVRLDSLKKHDNIADISSYSRIPMIATNKSSTFQGNFTGTESERQNILVNAAKNGFKYIDIDLGRPNQTDLINTVKENGAKVIISYHNFKYTPLMSKLTKVLHKEVALGADICKIITTARCIEDNLITLNFTSSSSKQNKIVCFAMGKLGKVSRLLSPVFGAFFTFASLDEMKKTAKGQLTIQKMKLSYESLGIRYDDNLRKN